MADYTYGEGRSTGGKQAFNSQWWLVANQGKEVYHDIFGFTRHLRRSQAVRNERLLRNMRLYGNLLFSGMTMESYNKTDDALRTQNRLTLNIIKSMTDTMVNKLGKNKPMPTYLTDGGSWQQQQEAKKLQKFMSGIFHFHDLYETGKTILRDAAIFNTGVLKIFRENSQLYFERTLPFELYVDDLDAFYGSPRTIYQIKNYPKDTLINMFPEFEKQIHEAAFEDKSQLQGRHTDMVSVVESWRLGTPTDDPDVLEAGKHAITISNADLLVEDYTRNKFPFVTYHWSNPLLGYWGSALADDLVGIQIEINKILRTIQRAMHLLSVPKVFVEHGSKVVSQHFNNEIGGIIKYTGTKPMVEAFNSVSPELFIHLDRLYQRAYEIAGVSQLAAQAKKPEGLDSGKALRTFNDIETERFITLGQRYENFFLEIADHVIDLSEEIQEEDPDFGVMSVGKRTAEEIKFKDINLDRKKFVMKVFPTSALSETPSARLQEVQELAQAGFITRERAIALLDFPDLENAYNELTAPQEIIELVAEQMLEKGVFVPPDPYMNLDVGIKVMTYTYLRARISNVPENRLDLLRTWINKAQELLQKAERDLMQQQLMAQQQALPNARPETAPTSDLLPVNTPQAQQVLQQ